MQCTRGNPTRVRWGGGGDAVGRKDVSQSSASTCVEVWSCEVWSCECTCCKRERYPVSNQPRSANDAG